jgi:hypothetical protein
LNKGISGEEGDNEDGIGGIREKGGIGKGGKEENGDGSDNGLNEGESSGDG